jgi:release factor glutamine methyltransferase
MRALATEFRAAGLDTPELDARMLLLHCAGIALEDLARDPAAPLGETAAAALRRLGAARLAGAPVARLLGQKEFWGLTFDLAPDTLVPRPDTETLVEAVLATVGDRMAPLRILDLGTGTGAILVALLSELPRAEGIGIDLSPEAAATAAANAARLGVGARAMVVAGDWAAAIDGRFDLVVSNPPYIRSGDVAALAREVRAHDPRLALDGGVDGLDAYRAVFAAAARLLVPGGRCAVELGIGQADAASALMGAAGLQPIGPASADLAGIPRVLMGRR